MAKSTTEQETNSPQNTDSSTSQPVNDDSSCAVMKSRNWHAWIDRVAENEPRLNISGEVDLPSPGYKIGWKQGVLDRRQPPSQRLLLVVTPPEAAAVHPVIIPTEVSYAMPASSLEYKSIIIYCGEQLLTEIPDVVPTE